MRLRSDTEPAVRALVGQLGACSRARDNRSVVVETGPTKSSSSMGGVERYAQTVTGLVRTHVVDIQRRFG
eukprot:8977375-Heterocapsa_arctica.AAC.1